MAAEEHCGASASHPRECGFSTSPRSVPPLRPLAPSCPTPCRACAPRPPLPEGNGNDGNGLPNAKPIWLWAPRATARSARNDRASLPAVPCQLTRHGRQACPVSSAAGGRSRKMPMARWAWCWAARSHRCHSLLKARVVVRTPGRDADPARRWSCPAVADPVRQLVDPADPRWLHRIWLLLGLASIRCHYTARVPQASASWLSSSSAGQHQVVQLTCWSGRQDPADPARTFTRWVTTGPAARAPPLSPRCPFSSCPALQLFQL